MFEFSSEGGLSQMCVMITGQIPKNSTRIRRFINRDVSLKLININ